MGSNPRPPSNTTPESGTEASGALNVKEKREMEYLHAGGCANRDGGAAAVAADAAAVTPPDAALAGAGAVGAGCGSDERWSIAVN